LSATIQVEVVYALRDRQVLRRVTLAPGSVVSDAVRASGILADFPEIDLSINRVGIYGELARLDTALRDRDRVEILRPLPADPKEIRRRRARTKRGVPR
jgi:putative ubiquitin-RnfH superfamily antitoxin RatB of RatAB toxin-antitoxin module